MVPQAKSNVRVFQGQFKNNHTWAITTENTVIHCIVGTTTLTQEAQTSDIYSFNGNLHNNKKKILLMKIMSPSFGIHTALSLRRYVTTMKFC